MNLRRTFISCGSSQHSDATVFGRILTAAVLLAAISILLLGCKSKLLLHPQLPDKITWAAMVGDLELLKTLEAQGVSLSYQSSRMYDWTPLMAAIPYRQTNVINYLLSRNVDLNTQDRNGETALIRAVREGDTNTARMLLQQGADATIADTYGITAYENARAGYSDDPDARAALLQWLGKPNR